jgi:hypothetical protein
VSSGRESAVARVLDWGDGVAAFWDERILEPVRSALDVIAGWRDDVRDGATDRVDALVGWWDEQVVERLRTWLAPSSSLAVRITPVFAGVAVLALLAVLLT